MGPRIEIKKLVPYELTIYVDMVNKALIIERKVNEERVERKRNQMKKNMLDKSQGQNNSRYAFCTQRQRRNKFSDSD